MSENKKKWIAKRFYSDLNSISIRKQAEDVLCEFLNQGGYTLEEVISIHRLERPNKNSCYIVILFTDKYD